MATVRDLIALLDQIAQPALAEEWDNVGLLVGTPEQEISSIFVALDPTLEILDEAKRKGCNVVVTHHPLIFKGLRAVRTDHPEGRLLACALADRLAILGCHTNLDKVSGGVSDMLAAHLGLSSCQVLAVDPGHSGVNTIGFGRCGYLPKPMAFAEFTRFIRERLALPVVKVAGTPPREISKVAVCGGSGSDLAPVARAAGAQVYVSGEIKHSMARWAESVGFCVVDGGHFATENLMVVGLAKLIRSGFAGQGKVVEVLTTDSQTCPFCYY
ncbi:MAG: Nif3-like dinuclear metal center hexameric protein [Desulfobulbaceae bacterium]|nr:Nif3-like dinuclear metal center hexameric protein [Desulfobulbaceae bacterium]